MDDSNFEKQAIPEKVDTSPIATLSRRELLRKSGRLAGALAVPSMVGIGAMTVSSSAIAWGPWHYTDIFPDGAGGEAQSVTRAAGLGDTWTKIIIRWRNSDDALWKDGNLTFIGPRGQSGPWEFNYHQIIYHTYDLDGKYVEVKDLDVTERYQLVNLSERRDYGLAARTEENRELLPLSFNDLPWMVTEQLYNLILEYYNQKTNTGLHVYDTATSTRGGSLFGVGKLVITAVALYTVEWTAENSVPVYHTIPDPYNPITNPPKVISILGAWYVNRWQCWAWEGATVFDGATDNKLAGALAITDTMVYRGGIVRGSIGMTIALAGYAASNVTMTIQKPEVAVFGALVSLISMGVSGNSFFSLFNSAQAKGNEVMLNMANSVLWAGKLTMGTHKVPHNTRKPLYFE